MDTLVMHLSLFV